MNVTAKELEKVTRMLKQTTDVEQAYLMGFSQCATGFQVLNMDKMELGYGIDSKTGQMELMKKHG